MSHLTETLAEFDKEFPELATVHHTEGEVRTIYGTPAEHLVKTFITSRYKDLEEKIEAMRRTTETQMNDDHVYDEALDDVLSIIRDNH